MEISAAQGHSRALGWDAKEIAQTDLPTVAAGLPFIPSLMGQYFCALLFIAYGAQVLHGWMKMKSLDNCALYLSPWWATSFTSALRSFSVFFRSVSVFVASLRPSYLTLFYCLLFFSDALTNASEETKYQTSRAWTVPCKSSVNTLKSFQPLCLGHLNRQDSKRANGRTREHLSSRSTGDFSFFDFFDFLVLSVVEIQTSWISELQIPLTEFYGSSRIFQIFPFAWFACTAFVCFCLEDVATDGASQGALTALAAALEEATRHIWWRCIYIYIWIYMEIYLYMMIYDIWTLEVLETFNLLDRSRTSVTEWCGDLLFSFACVLFMWWFICLFHES